MKSRYTFLFLFLSLMNSVNLSLADDIQADAHNTQETQDMEDRLIHAIDRNNKAQILGYIKQDPSLLFSLIDSDDFVEDPDKIIRMLTVMKKAGVNLNYQDEDGSTILHAAVEVYIIFGFGIPAIGVLINSIVSGISKNFTGEGLDLDDEDYFSESDFIEITQSTQKIVKGLLSLGVKKKLKDGDGYTAADHIKAYIDEFASERGEYKQGFAELDKLYKMLK